MYHDGETVKSKKMEELANAVTHGIGLALSLLGAVLLILAAAWSRNMWVIVSCCVYAATLVSLYAASTSLHSVHLPDGRAHSRPLTTAASTSSLQERTRRSRWSACAADGAGRFSAWSGASVFWACS
jgi:hemolysin III-related protein